jgi:glycine/D-amino acid oxidase-like deaminating enzyme
MSTVILGGGIIGLSTAYYLSQTSPTEIKIIDSSPHLLASASGFAGGFLARDWFVPSVAALGELSFDLHRQLAEQHAGQRRWGYAKSTALSLSVEEPGVESNRKEAKKERGEDWLLQGTSRSRVASKPVSGRANGRGERGDEFFNDDGSPRWVAPQEGGSMETISSAEGCAQVEPMKLCEFLREECEKRGVTVWTGTKATGVLRDDKGMVKGLKIQRNGGALEEVQCSILVITAGAWTPRVYEELFPESKLTIPIEPLAGHSCVIHSRHFIHYRNPKTSPDNLPGDGKSEHGHHAIFSAPGPRWKTFAPEVISRVGRDGEAELYVAGLNSRTLPLPELATNSKIDESSRKELREVTMTLTGEKDLDIVREAVCFRPVVTKGIGPIIGKVHSIEMENGGVFVASGHGPWGISLSLGTGKVMSEMVRGVDTSADVKELGKLLQ